MSDTTIDLPGNATADFPQSPTIGGTGISNDEANTITINVGPVAFTAASSAGSAVTFPASGVVQTAAVNSVYANAVVKTSATPGTDTAIHGSISDTATTMTSGQLTGVTGDVTLPTLKSVTGGFLYGTVGQAILNGTLNGASVAGVFGALNLASSTLTSGNMACVWADAGATGPTQTVTGFNMFRATNVTNTTANSHFSGYGKAVYFLDGQLNGSTWFANAGTSAGSAGDTSKCNATKVLKIQVDGTPYYLAAFAQNT